MASVAKLKKLFFAEIDKVVNRKDLEKLHVKFLGREKGILTAVLRSLGGMPLAKRKELGPQTPQFSCLLCSIANNYGNLSEQYSPSYLIFVDVKGLWAYGYSVHHRYKILRR
jgi:hypothetical protein